MVNENMKINEAGLEFIKNEEGVVLHKYLDAVKIPTIGIGHVILSNENFNNGITLQQALDILSKDVSKFEKALKDNITVELNQNQWNALVSLTFNTGSGPIMPNHGLHDLLNAGNFDAIPTEMAKWSKAGGATLPALYNRRVREGKLFMTPIEVKADEPIDPSTVAPIITPEFDPLADHEEPNNQ